MDSAVGVLLVQLRGWRGSVCGPGGRRIFSLGVEWGQMFPRGQPLEVLIWEAG